MQSLKLESLKKFNDVLQCAFISSPNFPDIICEFLVNEYNFDAAVLLEANADKFNVLGKSAGARESFKRNKTFGCSECLKKNNSNDSILFDSHQDCQVAAADQMFSDGSLFLNSPSGSYLLKLAKKNTFNQDDKNNLQIVGSTVITLIAIWRHPNSNLVPPLSTTVSDISHDLRTPLNSIMGFASLLSEDNLTPSQ
ncbi:MAG: hypothetical protein EHM47_15365, partial [Ignavibacteriales bacterium]